MIKKVRAKLYEIIFGTDTFGGKLFDLLLLVVILISVITVMLETVPSIGNKYGYIFDTIEWTVTILFSIEYLVRIWIVPKPFKYIFSFYGIIDLLSLSPTYLGIFFRVEHSLMVIRSLRLIRIFRILNLPSYSVAGKIIWSSLKSARQKIIVFLVAVITIVFVIGTLMYLIEGPENGFSSIPESIYWAVVTITTVGYGDIAPHTPLGKFLSTLLMLTGYSVIAVPTGIVTVALSKDSKMQKTKVCPRCKTENDSDANYCKICGERLESQNTNQDGK